MPKTAETIVIKNCKLIDGTGSRLEAISPATRTGAEVFGVADRLGTIERNKIADLLIIDGDPSKNIKELRQVVTIIQGGQIIKNDLN